mmetsp:Transcript_12299/g.33205  ORF Transcript_12299/g.33205 Transcript_12299/m.33205 type:complete len:265 (-) Transcript_12299:173-967(-)|eukprot:CAMPEP_0185834004 /NCGR_PEP_ID=MMETSP1353-20130828/3766_1 /TAXON_ID=1077150 /ORGANISM="Erythrolobus australicus, Strain CCMP3124" /LENGTH=264 /DNA_ID=CAMNT_0028532351 /DNA_START=56 /DNA_END=850 /DNA_ORIENTATION=+
MHCGFVCGAAAARGSGHARASATSCAMQSARARFASGSAHRAFVGERVATPQGVARTGAAGIVMMPIGVPKVAYRVPGSAQAEWVDIYNRLYRERIIFLGQEIDDEIANQIIAVLLYLESEDNSKPIYMYINSPGGSVIAGLAMYDTMRHIQSEIITINVGLAASMASFLLGAGEKGKRLALPHSRTMIHQPMGGAQGQASDIKVEAQQILRIKKNLINEYSKMTGQTYEKLVKDLDRDNFMSAYEAKDYGLIDNVIEGKSTAM